MTITSSTRKSADKSWATTIAKIRHQAQDSYVRNLSLAQRVRFVHEYLLLCAWYVAQIYPPSQDHSRQLNTTMTWYIWKGQIYKVPISTLYRHKSKGVWALTHFEAKCYALLLQRTQTQITNRATLTSTWLRDWKFDLNRANPPYAVPNAVDVEYTRLCTIELAYVAKQGSDDKGLQKKDV
jgi:hypothetical protein